MECNLELNELSFKFGKDAGHCHIVLNQYFPNKRSQLAEHQAKVQSDDQLSDSVEQIFETNNCQKQSMNFCQSLSYMIIWNQYFLNTKSQWNQGANAYRDPTFDTACLNRAYLPPDGFYLLITNSIFIQGKTTSP